MLSETKADPKGNLLGASIYIRFKKKPDKAKLVLKGVA